jgi:hypothetical protein
MSKPANNDIRPSEELPDPGTEKIQRQQSPPDAALRTAPSIWNL